MSNNQDSVFESVRPVRQSPSLFAALEVAKAQIEYDTFNDTALASDIALIIAEIYVLPPESIVRIGGAELNAEIVREVYTKITCECACKVYDSFRSVKYPVRNPKAYLRSMLYNAVFETSAY